MLSHTHLRNDLSKGLLICICHYVKSYGQCCLPNPLPFSFPNWPIISLRSYHICASCFRGRTIQFSVREVGGRATCTRFQCELASLYRSSEVISSVILSIAFEVFAAELCGSRDLRVVSEGIELRGSEEERKRVLKSSEDG